MGSSLIVKAHNHVKTRPMGSDLVLFNTHGVKIIWAGSSGLPSEHVISLCKNLKKYVTSVGLDTPKYLLIHAGGNDIGKIPAHSLRSYICKVLDYLREYFPGVSIVWSSILPL